MDIDLSQINRPLKELEAYVHNVLGSRDKASQATYAISHTEGSDTVAQITEALGLEHGLSKNELDFCRSLMVGLVEMKTGGDIYYQYPLAIGEDRFNPKKFLHREATYKDLRAMVKFQTRVLSGKGISIDMTNGNVTAGAATVSNSDSSEVPFEDDSCAISCKELGGRWIIRVAHRAYNGGHPFCVEVLPGKSHVKESMKRWIARMTGGDRGPIAVAPYDGYTKHCQQRFGVQLVEWQEPLEEPLE